MINRKVVLVLGAGASMSYGFPSGSGLLAKAVENVAGVSNILNKIGITNEQLTLFRNELRRSKVLSVDAFLEHRPDLLDVGKAIIAYELICCEQESVLLNPINEDDWYGILLNMMKANDFESFKHNKIGFITYNYDRSLEYVIFGMLQSLYNKSKRDCAAMLSHIPIVHVHGQLGMLPGFTGKSRPYSNNCTRRALQCAVDGIRIIHEDIDDDPVFGDAHQLLSSAEHVVFLGFGYLSKNVERLKLQQSCNGNVSFHGTALGTTESEKNEIVRLFPTNIKGNQKRPTISLPKGSWKAKEFLRNNLSMFMTT